MGRDEVPPIEDPQVTHNPPLSPPLLHTFCRLRKRRSEDDSNYCSCYVQPVEEVERTFLFERGLGGSDPGEPVEWVAGAALHDTLLVSLAQRQKERKREGRKPASPTVRRGSARSCRHVATGARLLRLRGGSYGRRESGGSSIGTEGVSRLRKGRRRGERRELDRPGFRRLDEGSTRRFATHIVE